MNKDEQPVNDKRSEYTNTSRCLHIGPLKICCVMLAGDGANADCQVYDGVNAKGELKAHVEALSGTTFAWGTGLGVTFNTGLYIAVNASTAKVTATFAPVSRKDV